MRWKVSLVFLIGVVVFAEGSEPNVRKENLDRKSSTSIAKTSPPKHSPGKPPSGKQQGGRYTFPQGYPPPRKWNPPPSGKYGIDSATVDANVVAESMGDGGFVIAPNDAIIKMGGSESEKHTSDYRNSAKVGMKLEQTEKHNAPNHNWSSVDHGPTETRQALMGNSPQSAQESVVETHGSSIPHKMQGVYLPQNPPGLSMHQNAPVSQLGQEYFMPRVLPGLKNPQNMYMSRREPFPSQIPADSTLPQNFASFMPEPRLLSQNHGYEYSTMYGPMVRDPLYPSPANLYMPRGFERNAYGFQAGGNGFQVGAGGLGFQAGSAVYQPGAGGLGFQAGGNGFLGRAGSLGFLDGGNSFLGGARNLEFQAGGFGAFGPTLETYQPGVASYSSTRSVNDPQASPKGISNTPYSTQRELGRPKRSMLRHQAGADNIFETPMASEGYAALLELGLNGNGGTTKYKNIRNITKTTDRANTNRLFPRILRFSATVSNKTAHCTLNLTGIRELEALFKNKPDVHCNPDSQASSPDRSHYHVKSGPPQKKNASNRKKRMPQTNGGSWIPTNPKKNLRDH